MVMAVYNGEKYIKESLDYALAQTYPNLEWIIVNDGSTDTTAAILEEIEDERVKVIHLQKNQGAAHALNVGIKKAQGEWIAIQDADDHSLPERISEQINYLQEHPDLIGVGSLVKCISGDPQIPDENYVGLQNGMNGPVSRQHIRYMMHWGCPLTHSTVMFHKETFWKVGGYDVSYKIAYDYDLWLRLLEKGDFEKVPKVLVEYTTHADSLSQKDILAMVNEVQTASARAISRKISQEKQRQPQMIVIGPKQGCDNFDKNIASQSVLSVESIVIEEASKKLPAIVKKITAGTADGLIVLEGSQTRGILWRLGECQLTINKNLFVLYNILE